MRVYVALLIVVFTMSETTPAYVEEMDSVMMTGVCRKLATPTDDLSETCKSTLVSATYTRGGRVDFHFSSSTHILTFSGSAKEIRVSDNTGVQVIDKVTIASRNDARAINAVGSCRYTHLSTSASIVNCRAETEEGNFLASFGATSGKEAHP